ncbi:GspH/FimT family pseudopilin [Alkalimonas sp. MEB108]|uniref:Type II secretion system protein H n=1 Tax=Alkalimonas cellulosilytica TaxID=3058395 RepID=A0ABU7J7U2_9GAMM|nr:GspH/FimT family pseudopilin [Alkalimonas sp. MEB108]MEE2002608.1 GspH/FimT family pseudopilin [Alkalimonas sp. MEB108]
MHAVKSGKETGFTLIELMVTVAVMAIVLTVAVPAFTNVINSNRLTSQANELLSTLSFARSEAIRRNADVIFCHSQDGSSCSAPAGGNWQGWIVFANADPSTILATGRLHNQLRVLSSSNLSNAAFSLRYNAQGFIRQAGNTNLLSGTIRMCHPSGTPEQNVRDVRFISGGRATVSSASSAACATPDN